MSRALWIRFVSLALCTAVLAACGGEPPPPPETSRPVKTIVVEGLGGSGIREFPGRIEANRQAELSFRVRGTVNAIHVREGDQVEEGQLLAELDKTDYQIAVNNQQAQFDNAEKNFTRARELVETGAISRMDFDRMEATFKSAEANLEAAKQNLAYTVMRAPFPGVIGKRHVENFEQVLANQTIFTLQEVSILEVEVDVPERLIRRIARPAPDVPLWERPARAANVVAYFPQNPAVSYPLTVKEVATKADPATQTFQVTFMMPSPEGVTVLPGMTVSVRADLSNLVGTEGAILIPATAISGSASLNPQVWIVDEATMTIHPRAVRLGELEGGRIQVLEGLKGGERVVVAGVGALADGMKVTLMQPGEQAEPREHASQGE
jgi:RND family efflux transporter MFP subunit